MTPADDLVRRAIAMLTDALAARDRSISELRAELTQTRDFAEAMLKSATDATILKRNAKARAEAAERRAAEAANNAQKLFGSFTRTKDALTAAESVIAAADAMRLCLHKPIKNYADELLDAIVAYDHARLESDVAIAAGEGKP